MLEIILFAVGLVGFGLAGYYDLRYTEFHDILPYSLIIIVLLIRGVFAFLSSDFSILINSAITGLLFLGLGFILYLTKQWGDGDAWLLGCFGFLFSDPQSMLFLNGFNSLVPFQLAALFNFFIISVVYIILYSFVIGLRTPGIYKDFTSAMNSNKKKLYGSLSLPILVLAAAFYFFLTAFYQYSFIFSLLTLLLVCLVFFGYYTKSLEKLAFRKKISTKNLKEGDVLIGNRWRSLTKKEVAKLKRTKKYVQIKEGVRFAPVFIITLLITVLFGGLLFL